MTVARISLLFPFKMRSHSSPADLQGQLYEDIYIDGRSAALGDGRHCPHFEGLRLGFAVLFNDAHSAMQTLLWHKAQKAVFALMLAIRTEAPTRNKFVRIYDL